MADLTQFISRTVVVAYVTGASILIIVNQLPVLLGIPAEVLQAGGKLVITQPWPSMLRTLWGDDERFVKTYFSTFSKKQVYSTFDWGIRDEDGYFHFVAREDDELVGFGGYAEERRGRDAPPGP